MLSLRSIPTFAASVALAITALGATAQTADDATQQPKIVPGITERSVRNIISENPDDPVTGIWSATDNGSRLAIISAGSTGNGRSLTDNLLIIVIKSAQPGIAPGTVMGTCSPLAKSGYYDAELFTECNGNTLSSPKRFTLRMNDGGSRLSLIEADDGIEITAWRILPYMFRRMLKERKVRDTDLDGFIRIWPVNNAEPMRVRYL